MFKLINAWIMFSICRTASATTCDKNNEKTKGWGDSARCWWYSGGCQPECGGFKPNFCAFRTDLDEQFYGQHIAKETVLKAVTSHWSNQNPNKALVMSFQGLSGVGKTYLANLIVKHMYGAGINSPFAHKIHSEFVFKDPSKVQTYIDELQSWIHGNVTTCERSVFIFDEMNHMPEGIINALKPFLEPQPMFNGVDYRKTMFIFISNVGGKEITKRCFAVSSKGKTRESITLSQLQIDLRNSAFEQKNGLRGSGIIDKNLIDHFIPFLPLAEEHVKNCILNEIDQNRPSQKYREDIFDRVLNELEWYNGVENDDLTATNRFVPAKTSEEHSELFYSKSGCTNVASKVALHLHTTS